MTSKYVPYLFIFIITLTLVTVAEANTKNQLLSFKSDDFQLEEGLKTHRIQITETLENKKSNLELSHKKLSTDLLSLINEDFILPGQTKEEQKKEMQNLKQLRRLTTAEGAVNGATDNYLVYVYIYLKPPIETNIVDSIAHEVTHRDEGNHVAVAWVEIDSLDALAKLDSVRAVQTVLPPLCNIGSVTSEGDSILRADLVRNLGQDGTGVKIGIISDGVDHWMDAQKSGDLPLDMHILSNEIGGDEGTAMMEIVHDLAPGAELYFHDCGYNYIAFNSAIDNLIAAGCKVICDDITWLDQPFFQDGPIAQHVADKIAENNIIYVSSAGNYAQSHYQGLYFNDGLDYHDFSSGTSSNKDIYLDIPPGKVVNVALQWDDEFFNPVNDYDLYLELIDARTGEYVGCRTSNYSHISGVPSLERIRWSNKTGRLLLGIITVKKYSGVAKTLEMFVFSKNNFPDNIVPQDSIIGHPAIPGVIAVGAIDFPNENEIASYSSQGPVTIKHPNTIIRNKPDVCGIAGVKTTGAGGFSNGRFYGTSAAAPHVAAIAALVWAEDTSKTAGEISSALLSQSEDLGVIGFDNVYGHGKADTLSTFNYLTADKFGDINDDGTISILDFLGVAQNIGEKKGDPNWESNKKADVNADNVINILDLLLVNENIESFIYEVTPTLFTKTL